MGKSLERLCKRPDRCKAKVRSVKHTHTHINMLAAGTFSKRTALSMCSFTWKNALLLVAIFLSGRATQGELATFAVNPRGMLGKERQISYLDVLLADQSRRGKVFDRSVAGLKDPVNVDT